MTSADESKIRDLAAAGVSMREIARQVGYSRTTVAKVLAKPEIPAHMQPPAAPDPSTFATETPAIDTVRELLRDARSQVATASAVGDSQLAQRHTRNAAALASVLARLERVEATDSDVLRISRAEIKEIDESLRERIAAIVSRPLLCEHCSRELSVSWGTGGETHADPNVNARAR